MDEEGPSVEEFQTLARVVSDRLQADILFFIGDITDGTDHDLIDVCRSRTPKPNVLLVITTGGGSPNAAFRMARCLQRRYRKFTVYVRDHCKSAGTLFALGADELIMSDHSELGPLDVQVFKPDELGEMSSGLTLSEAMTALRTYSYGYWERQFLRIRASSGLQISTRSAAQIATEMMVGVFAPIYQQIDPMRLGELERATKISVEYGQRLGRKNLKPDALITLVTAYPSHNFVIDKDEARQLFRSVRDPSEEERALLEAIDEELDIFAQIANDESEPFVAFFEEFLEIVREGAEQSMKRKVMEVVEERRLQRDREHSKLMDRLANQTGTGEQSRARRGGLGTLGRPDLKKRNLEGEIERRRAERSERHWTY